MEYLDGDPGGMLDALLFLSGEGRRCHLFRGEFDAIHRHFHPYSNYISKVSKECTNPSKYALTNVE
jgi:hypothetical protein